MTFLLKIYHDFCGKQKQDTEDRDIRKSNDTCKTGKTKKHVPEQGMVESGSDLTALVDGRQYGQLVNFRSTAKSCSGILQITNNKTCIEISTKGGFLSLLILVRSLIVLLLFLISYVIVYFSN